MPCALRWQRPQRRDGEVKLRQPKRPLGRDPYEPTPSVAVEARGSDLRHEADEIERLGQIHDAHLTCARLRAEQVLSLDRTPESRARLALGRHALRSGAGVEGLAKHLKGA
jgi:hypothetical protein